jgi:hypothetical protein
MPAFRIIRNDITPSIAKIATQLIVLIGGFLNRTQNT